MKTSIKCIWIAILLGSLQVIFILGSNHRLLLSDIILHFSFSNLLINKPSIIDASFKLFPLFVFQILLGIYMYKRFCSASIYYFSRCKNRIIWFLKESFALYPYTLLYLLVMIASATIETSFWHPVTFDKESFILGFYFLAIYSMWLFSTTLLINIIAIQFNNSSLAFSVVAGLQLTSMVLLLIWEGASKALLFPLPLNPFSHLVLSWHSSYIHMVNERINQQSIPFDLNLSLLLLIVVVMVIIASGCVVVNRKEFIAVSKEMEDE